MSRNVIKIRVPLRWKSLPIMWYDALGKCECSWHRIVPEVFLLLSSVIHYFAFLAAGWYGLQRNVQPPRGSVMHRVTLNGESFMQSRTARVALFVWFSVIVHLITTVWVADWVAGLS